MWSTDSVRVFTVDGGWVWTFAAVGPLKRRVRGLAGVQVCVVDSRTAPSWGRRTRHHPEIARCLRRSGVDAVPAIGAGERVDERPGGRGWCCRSQSLGEGGPLSGLSGSGQITMRSISSTVTVSAVRA